MVCVPTSTKPATVADMASIDIASNNRGTTPPRACRDGTSGMTSDGSAWTADGYSTCIATEAAIGRKTAARCSTLHSAHRTARPARAATANLARGAARWSADGAACAAFGTDTAVPPC